MNERVLAKNQTSATPSQAIQASSPPLHQSPSTSGLSESFGSNSNISKGLGGIQPKTIRRSLNWQNISVEAPSQSDGRSSPGGIQRRQEEPGAVMGDRLSGDSVQKSALESSNSTISTEKPAQKPLIARSPLNGRNIPIEAPPRSAASSTSPGGIQRLETSGVKEQQVSTESLQRQPEGAIQAKSSEGEPQEKEGQNKESVQTKLTVGAPGDKYEQEADSMAAKVMRMPDPAIQQPIQRQTGKGTAAVQMQPLVNSITPVVQRSSGKQKEVPMKPGVQRAPDGSSQASASVEKRLAGSKGGGSPLPKDVRSFMEPRFGADLSAVRAHTDSNAVQMNKELGAQAFAHGSDIYYGTGKSPGIDELTAHEVTHIIQNGGGVPTKSVTQQEKKENKLQAKADAIQLTSVEPKIQRMESPQAQPATDNPAEDTLVKSLNKLALEEKEDKNSQTANPAEKLSKAKTPEDTLVKTLIDLAAEKAEEIKLSHWNKIKSIQVGQEFIYTDVQAIFGDMEKDAKGWVDIKKKDLIQHDSTKTPNNKFTTSKNQLKTLFTNAYREEFNTHLSKNVTDNLRHEGRKQAKKLGLQESEFDEIEYKYRGTGSFGIFAKIPGGPSSGVSEKLKNAVNKGTIVDFMKAMSQNQPFKGIAKTDFDNYWKKADDRDFLKNLFRAADPGKHEWLPSNMISEVINRASEASDWAVGVKWIDFQHAVRTPTKYLIFDPDTFTEGTATIEETEGDIKETYTILQGHVGAVYIKSGGKLVPQCKGQPKWHKDLRELFTTSDTCEKLLKGIKTHFSNTIWKGNDTTATIYGKHHDSSGTPLSLVKLKEQQKAAITEIENKFTTWETQFK